MVKRLRDLLARAGPGLLLLAALLARLPGIWQNLPYVFQWDEPTLVNLAIWFFTEGSLNPRYFNYPSGMPYLLALLYSLVLLGGRVFGSFPSLAEGVRRLSAGTYPRPPGGEILYRSPTRGVPILYILGRSASAILGTFSVLWSFRLGWLLGGVPAAWLAGGLLALNAFHAESSTLLTTDVACSAFLTWFVLLLLQGARPWKAGIALGLSMACKYTGGIGIYLWPLGLLFPPVGLQQEATPPRNGSDRRAWNRQWLHLLPWAGGTFLLLNPYVLLTPGAFLHGFSWEAAHMRAGTSHFGEGIALGPAGLRVIASALLHDFGILPLAGVASALVSAFRSRVRDARARALLLLAIWCASYLLQLMSWKTAYPRYLLPIWPVLTTLAACGWISLTARLQRIVPGLRRAPLGLGLTVMILVPGLSPLGRSVAGRLRPDPRVVMGESVERLLGPDAVIAAEPAGPWIEQKNRQINRVDLLGRASAEAWRRQGVRYLIATGRESYLPPGSPDSIRTNRAQLAREGRILWQDGPYAIIDLGEGADPLSSSRRALEEGRAGEAASRLEAYRAVHPGDATAAALHGEALLALGDTSTAVDAFVRAGQLDPKDPTAFVALGSLALKAGQWDTAIAAFTRACADSPRDPAAASDLATGYLYRAQEAYRAGQSEAAARDLRAAERFELQAVSLRPEEPRFRLQEKKIRELWARWKLPNDVGP